MCGDIGADREHRRPLVGGDDVVDKDRGDGCGVAGHCRHDLTGPRRGVRRVAERALSGDRKPEAGELGTEHRSDRQESIDRQRAPVLGPDLGDRALDRLERHPGFLGQPDGCPLLAGANEIAAKGCADGAVCIPAGDARNNTC